jgi:amidase
MTLAGLWSLPAATIAGLVRSRQASAEEVARDALARLEAANPLINAVVDHRPEHVLAEARALDRRIAAGQDPGPLAGVPVTIKVILDQAGHATTNGLRTRRDAMAERDNPVVTRLRAEGAVMLGRTNTPAFSVRWFTRNSLHGWTRNPRAAGITPGGSSGGAAAAVAAGIGAIAHGTDIAGSIRYPAYACGVHGLRPTPGRVAAWNASGPDRLMDAALTAVSGPLARTVPDLRLGLAAMAQPDLVDPLSVPVPLQDAAFPKLPRRAALCPRPDGMATAPAVEAALRAAALRLQERGWTVVETPTPPLAEAARLQWFLWLAETRRAAAAFAAEADPDATEWLAQALRHAPEPTLAAYQDAFAARSGLMRRWDDFLARYPLVILPISAELPFPDHLDLAGPEAFDRVVAAQMTQIGLPLLGLPALALATGRTEGRPVGVQLVAPRWRDAWLLDVAAAIEDEGVAAPADPVVAP